MTLNELYHLQRLTFFQVYLYFLCISLIAKAHKWRQGGRRRLSTQTWEVGTLSLLQCSLYTWLQAWSRNTNCFHSRFWMKRRWNFCFRNSFFIIQHTKRSNSRLLILFSVIWRKDFQDDTLKFHCLTENVLSPLKKGYENSYDKLENLGKIWSCLQIRWKSTLCSRLQRPFFKKSTHKIRFQNYTTSLHFK